MTCRQNKNKTEQQQKYNKKTILNQNNINILWKVISKERGVILQRNHKAGRINYESFYITSVVCYTTHMDTHTGGIFL